MKIAISLLVSIFYSLLQHFCSYTKVPSQYTTIQEGIDNANENTILVVRYYLEQLTSMEIILLLPAKGADNTIIDGHYYSTRFAFFTIYC
jgi:hypothetical protein